MKILAILFVILFTLSCGSDVQRSSTSSSEEDTALYKKYDTSPFWEKHPKIPRENTTHPLYRFYLAATRKPLPTKILVELINANAYLQVKKGDSPRYKRRLLWQPGIILHPHVDKDLDTWGKSMWSTFYNELLHAWWDHIFEHSDKYKADRRVLFSQKLLRKYKLAHPNNPRRAQEESFSETFAALISFLSPHYLASYPDNKGFLHYEFFSYKKGLTVEAVSHSDSYGYTPAAENTYPSEEEYRFIFFHLTGHYPPLSNQELASITNN